MKTLYCQVMKRSLVDGAYQLHPCKFAVQVGFSLRLFHFLPLKLENFIQTSIFKSRALSLFYGTMCCFFPLTNHLLRSCTIRHNRACFSVSPHGEHIHTRPCCGSHSQHRRWRGVLPLGVGHWQVIYPWSISWSFDFLLLSDLFFSSWF